MYKVYISAAILVENWRLMSVILLSAMLLASVPVSLHAQSVSLTFIGEYKESTCNIDGTANFGVKLPTIPVISLDKGGMTHGSTLFTIKVKDCSSTTRTVETSFSSGYVNPMNGNLTLSNADATDAASNVEVQLRDDSDTVMKIGSSKKVYDVIDGAATMNFTARYYATGKTGKGFVATTAQYTLQYH